LNNKRLSDLLWENRYQPLTLDLATQIMALSMPQILVSREKMEAIEAEEHEGHTFALERLGNILEEMQVLHSAHWAEKEEEPDRPPFNPDYDTFIYYEKTGRCLVFTCRDTESKRLIGNFSLYLDRSMHTQALLATEDTLYLVPEARKGRLAARLIGYAERSMKQLGVTEINVTVKVDNKHGRYFSMLGYNHVSNGLTKLLEV
jgi:GNAT superfamily N-acetyltransferase